MNGQIEITVEQLLTKIGGLVMEIDMLRKALQQATSDTQKVKPEEK